MNDAATWITGGAALLLGVGQFAIALLLRIVRAEHAVEIQKLRTEIAQIPQVLNGTYPRRGEFAQLEGRVDRVERRLDEVI